MFLERAGSRRRTEVCRAEWQAPQPVFPGRFPGAAKRDAGESRPVPNMRLSVKMVIGDGDLVPSISRCGANSGRGGPGSSAHLSRFQGDKIVEFWDCGEAAARLIP